MPVEVVGGDSPIVLSLPYTGTNMLHTVTPRLSDAGLLFSVPDACLDQLLFGLGEGITSLRANFHRLLSDVDIPGPQEAGFRPIKGMVGVVPLLDADGRSIWAWPPDLKEAMNWHRMYYAPYHAALATQVAKVRARHGFAILLTCRAHRDPAHYIDAHHPAETICVCSCMGASSAIDLPARLTTLLNSSDRFSAKMNGRADCGWSTRHYGRPGSGVHAIDVRIDETSYLSHEDEDTQFDRDRAVPLRDLLADAFAFLSKWRPK